MPSTDKQISLGVPDRPVCASAHVAKPKPCWPAVVAFAACLGVLAVPRVHVVRAGRLVVVCWVDSCRVFKTRSHAAGADFAKQTFRQKETRQQVELFRVRD